MAAMPSDGASLHARDVRGLKYLRRLLPLFARLHEAGCQRDRPGNRELHFDEYCLSGLLYLFNPLINSMRGLLHACGLPNVQKLGLKRFSLGSFSEAPAVFDPQLLKEVIAELAAEARPLAMNPRLADLRHALTLVDGTVLEALPRLATAARADTRVHKTRDSRELHAFRLHTQLDLRTFQPRRIERTGGCTAGEFHESAVLRRSLEPDRCYVNDGAYYDCRLFDDIVAIGSSYVTRVREDCAFELIEERVLTPQDKAAGVVRDAVVRLGGAAPTQYPARLITLEIPPHLRRSRRAKRPHGGRTDKAYMGTVVCDRLTVASSLLDLPADLIALIYRQRYSVELFFRFLKGLLGMRHLLSHRPAGVEIQVYCTLIACLLINIETGRKPNKRMVETIGWFLLGLMDEQAVLDELNKPDNRGVKTRVKDALWKKLGF
jgi:hypothetical protein